MNHLSKNEPSIVRSFAKRLIALVAVIAAAIGLVAWFKSDRPTDPVGDDVNKEKPALVGPLLFQDVTAGSAVAFSCRTGDEAQQHTILESLGSGVLLIDYDGDGLLDLFFAGGGHFDGPTKTDIKGLPCKLFRNLGGWKFQDMTQSLGLGVISFYSHGGAVADYDRDGWPDLLVTGYGKLALFHNVQSDSGGRKFVDVTASVGLKDDSWSTSAAFADIDGDGFPDLYVCHYVDWSFANHPQCVGQVHRNMRDVCPPQKFKPLRHAFFQNQAGKKFVDTTLDQKFEAVGCGLGVVAADVNDDGRPDFYVGNDATNNQLYLNRGGKLEERGLSTGVALNDNGIYDGSMGVDIGDYDASGRASIWVTNFQGDVHGLYQNLGRELFHHRSHVSGIAAIGSHYVGFGTGFIDIDNDGWEDLAIANGHVSRDPALGSTFKQRPVLLRNIDRKGKRFFEEITSRGGDFFTNPTLGRGMAIGDLDNDGWPDLVFTHSNSPVALIRNIAAESNKNQWIGFNLVGKDNRCMVGSTVSVRAGDRTLTRFVKGGGSYLSNYDPRILFGLGAETGLVTVTVKWSWGKTETWTGLQPGQYWSLKEGTPGAVSSPKSK